MKAWGLLLSMLSLICIAIWFAVVTIPTDELIIVACDVGQGDAFLVSQGRNNIIIDGGPDQSVGRCVDDYLPFWDRSIELVILSHPQKDHFVGLIDIFKRYNVDNLLISEFGSDTQEFRVLEDLVGGGGTQVFFANSGRSLRLGMIYLDILHPSEEFIEANTVSGLFQNEDHRVLGTRTTKRDPNDFSLVVRITYGEFDALFTGDIGPEIIELIKDKFKEVEYLKVPHHGSKNGMTKTLLDAARPEIAVISAGKNNPHGHPHKEIIDLLERYKAKICRTDEDNEILVRTDGFKLLNDTNNKCLIEK